MAHFLGADGNYRSQAVVLEAECLLQAQLFLLLLHERRIGIFMSLYCSLCVVPLLYCDENCSH